ncbi:hypothetical protein [Chloroflexus sp.]|uniref:hypothetical protein n=1 Tax=Chloroflexus sp. TaxID=1904827 RepID=UPI002606E45A|nr:hypothetical protein [uncultured Chloroflexus sp.]
MSNDFDHFSQRVRAERGNFFDRERSITLVRAPGWVDLFGGLVADTGLLSLLWPTGGGVLVAIQPDPEPIIRFRVGQRTDSIPCTALFLPGGPREYADAVGEIDRHQPPRSPWWGPALMAWVALMREEFVRFGGGARVILQFSDTSVPAASVIVAVAQALVTAYSIHVAPRELAITCAEGLVRLTNRGAELPGTLVAVSAQAGEAMMVNARAAQIASSVHLPPGCAVWTIRAGDEPRQPLARVRSALARIDQLVSESKAEATLADLGIRGVLHHLRYQLTETIFAGERQPSVTLTALATFALAEHQRSRIGLALLRAAANRMQREDDLRLTGELLTQSHWEQAALGLTDPHADALVDRLVSPAIFGARQPVATTQATLVVFGRSDADDEVRRVAADYHATTGLPVSVTGGSVAGVSVSGVRSGGHN